MEFHAIAGGPVESLGAVAASSRGTLLTAGAGTHTKGAYSQLVAATARDYMALLISVQATGSGSSDALVDIAIGAGGSEVVVIPNLYCASATSFDVAEYLFPIFIPLGTRIAARCQTNAANGTVRVMVHGISYNFQAIPPANVVTAYGVNTADTGGVSVEPGGSSNTKGAYSEIISSTTRIIKGFIIGFGGQVNAVRTAANWLVDLAVGAAGSEQIIVADFPILADSTSDNITPIASPYIPTYIPIGTRLAARAQCSITDATDRLFDVIIYGVD